MQKFRTMGPHLYAMCSYFSTWPVLSHLILCLRQRLQVCVVFLVRTYTRILLISDILAFTYPFQNWLGLYFGNLHCRVVCLNVLVMFIFKSWFIMCNCWYYCIIIILFVVVIVVVGVAVISSNSCSNSNSHCKSSSHS